MRPRRQQRLTIVSTVSVARHTTKLLTLVDDVSILRGSLNWKRDGQQLFSHDLVSQA